MLNIRLPIPRFLTAGQVFAGKGSIGTLRALGASKTAVVVTRSLYRNDKSRQRIQAAIGSHAVELYEASGGEPQLDSLTSILAEITAFAPDWIVAVGGGSVIDSAKLLWAFYEHPDAELERITRPFGLPPLRGRARFAAVPTTAGSGSEVSSAAVFGEQGTSRKRAVVSHDFLPDLVILDPQFVAAAPPRVKAIAGMDALAHAIEGYVSRIENPLADPQAETAARLLLDVLPQVVAAPADEVELHQQMLIAAMMAGWVQNLKVPGAGHALAHQLGRFHVPHGLATGLCLVPALKMNAQDEHVQAKLLRLARTLGLNDVGSLFERIDALRDEVGLGGNLSACCNGQMSALLTARDEVVDGALADPCAKANPRSMDAAMFNALLDQLLSSDRN